MRRFNQAMVVVIMGVAVSMLLAQALESASREPAAAQEKHWAYEDSARTVGPACLRISRPASRLPTTVTRNR